MANLEDLTFPPVDAKGFVPDEARDAFFRKQRMKNENRSCFECTARNPTWISLSFGVYVCLECSAEHRRKGVHISFVRSVEMDKFSPDQMVQMACGGNGKAWEYFKQYSMGKTSDARRPIDYSSKIAVRYKEQLASSAKALCEQLNVACKAAGTVAPAAAAEQAEDAADQTPASPEASPVSAQSSKGQSSPVTATPAASSPAASPVAASSAAPAPAATSSLLVRRGPAESAGVSSAKSAAASTAKPAPAPAVATKQMAKQIEFDFDFDEIETAAAARPPPAAAPAPAPAQATPPVAAPAPKAETPTALSAAPGRTKSDSSVGGKYTAAKAISSEDFFGDLDQDTATARHDREMRYEKFSGAAAISSSAFFSGAEEEPADGWKSSLAAGAKAGLSKGSELLTTYLNKVRD